MGYDLSRQQPPLIKWDSGQFSEYHSHNVVIGDSGWQVICYVQYRNLINYIVMLFGFLYDRVYQCRGAKTFILRHPGNKFSCMQTDLKGLDNAVVGLSRILVWTCWHSRRSNITAFQQRITCWWFIWLFYMLQIYIYILVYHNNDVILSAMASQITSSTIVCSSGYSSADQRKHQSSAALAFVQRIQWRPVNSPHKGPATRKIFPFDDVIIAFIHLVPSQIAVLYEILFKLSHFIDVIMTFVWNHVGWKNPNTSVKLLASKYKTNLVHRQYFSRSYTIRWNIKRNSYNFIQEVHLKTSFVKRRPFSVGLNASIRANKRGSLWHSVVLRDFPLSP